MKERLVADWLTKAGERGGIDVAFCQVLLAQGCRILRFGHSSTEAGKDIIAIDRDQKLRAYQVKAGAIDLEKFNAQLPQVTMLVEAAVSHPNVLSTERHLPFFVTSGALSEPVQLLVRSLNDSWQRRGFEPLTLVGGPQLHAEFMDLSNDFWPVEPPEVRDFLSLYLAEGKGDLNRKGIAAFFRSTLDEKGSYSKTVVSRRIAAAGLFASYLLEPFYREADYWSCFCGWTIVAAHQARAAELHALPNAMWKGSFEVTKGAAITALEQLSTETLRPNSLRPSGFELDDYTCIRNTTAASAVAAYHLIQRGNDICAGSRESAAELVVRLEREERFLFWGESASPHFLALIWFLERIGAADRARDVLLRLIGALAVRNTKLSDDPLDGPEVSPDEVLARLFRLPREEEQPRRGRRAVASWSMESFIHLAARRGLRDGLVEQWSRITRVDMASFLVRCPYDLLLWDGAEGEEATRIAGKPQRWSELLADANSRDSASLPLTLQEDPDFALIFALAYPHRNSLQLVKALDEWFGAHENSEEKVR